MRLPSEFEQLFAADFDSPPFELATHVDRDNAFLSCYLDTRAGKKAAIEFLDRKAGHVRDTLRGVERFHFDRGSARIRAAIEENWVGEMQGMAVFSPGSEPTRNPIVVHSETPFDNRLVSFAVPELLPLVAQQQREPRFDLIWLRAGESGAPRSRYLEDIGGIQTSSRFGSESLTTLGGADVAGAIHQFKRPGSRPVGVAPRASWDCLSRPLLVAITPEVLPCVADLMPDWAADRLVGSIEVSAADSLEDVVGMARASLRKICRETAARVADVVTENDGLLGTPVTVGYRSTRDTLLDGHAETVFIADWDKPGLGLPNEAKIEMCIEALRRGVRVILAESTRLREAGGVACLRNKSSQRAPMPNIESNGPLEHVA